MFHYRKHHRRLQQSVMALADLSRPLDRRFLLVLDEQHRELTPPEGRTASFGREQAWVASVRDPSHALVRGLAQT